MKLFSGRLVRHSATPFGVVAQHRRRHGHGLVLCGFAVVGTWDLVSARLILLRREKGGEGEEGKGQGRGREGRGQGRAGQEVSCTRKPTFAVQLAR